MKSPYLALTVFLLLVAIGGLVIICIVIFIKRQVSRRKSRIWRAPFTPIGQGLSKTLKKDLYRKIDFSARVRHEPYVFTAEYQENWDSYMHDEKRTFQYRMLAMKRFSQLQNVILQANNSTTDLIIGNNIKHFLHTARQNILKRASVGDIEQYARLYNAARFDLKPFEATAYHDFVRLHEALMLSASTWRNTAPRECNESHHFHEDLNRSDRKQQGFFFGLFSGKRSRVMGSASSSAMNDKDVMEGENIHLDPLGGSRRGLDGISEHSSGSSVNSMAAPLISSLEDTVEGHSCMKLDTAPAESARFRRTHLGESSMRDTRVYYRPKDVESSSRMGPFSNEGSHGVEDESAHPC